MRETWMHLRVDFSITLQNHLWSTITHGKIIIFLPDSTQESGKLQGDFVQFGPGVALLKFLVIHWS